MWLITNFGFFSIVQKSTQKGSGKLTSRARARQDLAQLRERYLPDMGKIQSGGGTDYPYRAVATRTAIAQAFQQALLDIDYSNFKSSVGTEQGADRAAVYSKVWEVLKELETEPQPDPPPASLTKSAPTAGKASDNTTDVHLLPGPQDDDLPPNVSCGGVIFDTQGRVLLRKPAGEFDGYAWTFGKGKRRPGETLEAAALREAREECGVEATIDHRVHGVFRGGTGLNVYFKMRMLKVHGDHDPAETEKVVWVTPGEAEKLISQTRNALGRQRDLAVLQAAQMGIHEDAEIRYRLYTLCERKKRSTEALSYNALVQSFPEIVRLAREGGKVRTSQGGLFADNEE